MLLQKLRLVLIFSRLQEIQLDENLLQVGGPAELVEPLFSVIDPLSDPLESPAGPRFSTAELEDCSEELLAEAILGHKEPARASIAGRHYWSFLFAYAGSLWHKGA